MKNDSFLLQYRSLARPRPLWNETALYGGYTYIEMFEGIWISREHEYLLYYAFHGENATLRKEAIAELKTGKYFFSPSPLQQSDYTKLMIYLNRQHEICIDGYSYTFEQLSQRFPFIRFYTNSNYTAPNFISISTEELCKRSSTTLTLVNEKSFTLKSQLRNWANIIPYNAQFFDDSLAGEFSLEGGDHTEQS